MPFLPLFVRYLAAKGVLFAAAGVPFAVLSENPIHGQVHLTSQKTRRGAA